MERPCRIDKLNGTNGRISSWKALFRQIFVCSGVIMNFFIYGLFFGAPTVIVPQIRNQTNNTEAISMETASWLMSASSYGSIPWDVICPIIAEIYGRKVPYIILWINTIVCVALFYFSTSFIELFISCSLQGIFLATQMTIAIMVLTEYTSPNYRGMLMTFEAATFFWGVWISNAIGTFYHWKNIVILIFVCSVFTITTIFWPESPVWLATKGRFDECAKCHRWLKGDDKDSEEELKGLISLHRENFRRMKEHQRDNRENCVRKYYSSISAKRFYKPLMYAVLTTLLYHFSGKIAFTGYILDIIKTISVSESSAYEGMLVLDGVTVFGMYIAVFLSKFLKRRTLFLGAASIGVMFLFIVATYLYLVDLKVISQNKHLTLFFLIGYSLSMCCGPMLMSKCVVGEITPIKCRSLFLTLHALLISAICGIVLEMFPYIFNYFNPHGAFLFYPIASSIFICVLYKVFPETKGKTISDMEKYFSNYENVVQEEEVLMNSQ